MILRVPGVVDRLWFSVSRALVRRALRSATFMSSAAGGGGGGADPAGSAPARTGDTAGSATASGGAR